MQLFAPPPRTRFDLNFRFAGFDVQVHPLFWIMAIFLGANIGGLVPLLIWVAVVFVSILIHELGHSLAMRHHDVDSYIVLHMSGGLAIPKSARISELHWTRQAFIYFAGPLAGFIFAAIVIAVVLALGGSVILDWVLTVIPRPIAFLPIGGLYVDILIRLLLWVNVFWGIINLLPVFPLDGGNIARYILVRLDPWNGVKNSLWLSVITGAALAIAGYFALGSVYMALLFGILAFQSYQALNAYRGNRF